ncbi:hypothetical protein D7Y27_33760 [Corallococcus sp. AB004]|uniref:hypothetical protein n=1 Tax=Corallococcus exiguus TaxID=83462 RepID=UPI000EA37422|nr:hypothetical protein [Corallococcus exiguus]NPD26412.1 hypothetical protein [Corallococcus exiguus]RKI34165.1 hypothetical protein D7Y27_33760 [Corallococcus sp. AB004]
MTTEEGRTFVLRRYAPPGEPASYELSLYEDYLGSTPKELPLQGLPPEGFTSEMEALDQVRRWHPEVTAFEDVRRDRHVTIDFVRALKVGSLAPLRPSMTAEEVVDLLGVPEDVMPIEWNPGAVLWFYGVVQLYLERGRLQWLEIDDGVGAFTSLELSGWFLEPATTKTQLEEALSLRGIPFTREIRMEAPVLCVPGGFQFDFHAEVERIHALYWNHPLAVPSGQGTDRPRG